MPNTNEPEVIDPRLKALKANLLKVLSSPATNRFVYATSENMSPVMIVDIEMALKVYASYLVGLNSGAQPDLAEDAARAYLLTNYKDIYNLYASSESENVSEFINWNPLANLALYKASANENSSQYIKTREGYATFIKQFMIVKGYTDDQIASA